MVVPNGGSGADKTLKRERYARAKAVFYGAADRPTDARAAFLAQACGSDEALRQEVESLLASDRLAGGFIEVPAAELLADTQDVLGPPAGTGAAGADTPGACLPHLHPGNHLGPYCIEALLGVGGMGEVYLAHDARLPRLAALKIVGKDQAGSGADAALLREARHASMLNHPCICGVYEVGEVGGRPFIAMEYVEGETLRARVTRLGRIAAPDILRYGICIADALAHAHGRGVIHRDLKSANVMIGGDGHVKVLDFGLSRWLPDAAGATVSFATDTRVLAGTLDYMAPEVLLGAAADPRADLWSLGILLFEMAAGRPPFRRPTPFETSSSILRAPLPPLPDDLPVGLALVIERCLERAPSRRYPRASDVVADLQALQERGRDRRRVVAGLALRKLTSRRALRLVGGAGVAGAAALAALAAGVWWATDAAPLPAREIQSVAVLPLENASGPDVEGYFADGITEALITDLGATGVRRVISRTTAMTLRSARRSPTDIARELGVEAVVDGSVTRVNGRVGLTLRLRDGPTGRELWSAADERPARETGVLVSGLAAGIAGAMHHAVAPETSRRVSTLRTVDPAVYEAYLKGRYYWNERTDASLRLAVGFFQDAIARDPTYAPARVALADCYNQIGTMLVGSGSPADYRPLAEASVVKALQIDPGLAEAHATLGYIRHYDWKWDDSEWELVQAIRLNPNNPLAHIWYANLLVSRRRFSEAIREVQVALDLDPFSLAVITNVGWTLGYAGRRDEAIARFRQALELDPGYVQARMRLGGALAGGGRFDESISEYQAVVRLTGESTASLAALAGAYARAGRPAASRALLDRLLRESPARYVSPAAVAGVYEALGDADAAFAWMEKAYEERSNYMAYLAADGHARLRADPRFADLLRRTGLE